MAENNSGNQGNNNNSGKPPKKPPATPKPKTFGHIRRDSQDYKTK